MNQTQPSLNADDDRDSKATEALDAARLMPAGKEKSEALKRAGLLRKAADIHKPFPAKKQAKGSSAVFASDLLLRDDPVTHLRPLSARPISRGSAARYRLDLNQDDLSKFRGRHERAESEWELVSRNGPLWNCATPKKHAK